MKLKYYSTIVFILLNTIILTAQSIEVTRIDGIGAGNNFLDISDEMRASILDGTFDGDITYLPNQGPIQIEVVDSASYIIGTYELTFIDEDMSNDLLDEMVYWQLTHVQSAETVTSQFTIDEVPEQYVPEFGITIKVVQTPDVGELGQNNGAIGTELVYDNTSGPFWFSGIPDEWNPTYLNYIHTDVNEIDESLDPSGHLSNIGDGFFTPYTLCNWRPSPGIPPFGYLSPSWLNASSNLVRVGNPLSNLNNIDLVFTSDISKWSRSIILETASPEYYQEGSPGLGLATEENMVHGCQVTNMALRGAPSVGKMDLDQDGFPDPDGELFNGTPRVGMGWFPGYAINVETGKRVNIAFGENSTYSLDQDVSLLDLYGIDPDDFNVNPTGRDMMWNPTDQLDDVDAGDADGFPYPFYLGGQHNIYLTDQEYDQCELLYAELICNGAPIDKIKALREFTWTAMPVAAEGTSLLSYADGLIPNDLIVKLRVDNPFQVQEGTGQFNGYPTYQFEVPQLSSAFDQQNTSALNAISINSNPYVLANSTTLQLQNVPSGCDISVYTLDGQKVSSFSSHSIGDSSSMEISNYLPSSITRGLYFVHIEKDNISRKALKLIIM